MSCVKELTIAIYNTEEFKLQHLWLAAAAVLWLIIMSSKS